MPRLSEPTGTIVRRLWRLSSALRGARREPPERRGHRGVREHGAGRGGEGWGWRGAPDQNQRSRDSSVARPHPRDEPDVMCDERFDEARPSQSAEESGYVGAGRRETGRGWEGGARPILGSASVPVTPRRPESVGPEVSQNSQKKLSQSKKAERVRSQSKKAESVRSQSKKAEVSRRRAKHLAKERKVKPSQGSEK